MKLYNTLTRKLDKFEPVKKGEVGIYSCGPTVYWNQHIGHMYAYVQWDALVKTLEYLGNKVRWVMNVTDVGHLVSDEDEGEDKMEKGAKREGLTVWQVAEKYTTQFLESLDLLGVKRPDVLSKATEHIEEQIEMIKLIEEKGFTYKTKTGLVFDTSKFANYAKFGRLNLEKQKAGARTEVDEGKKQPWDFLLWVTNQPEHVMQWDSPWGKGFPGWHIECTAMSVKYLGEKFDIHTGGKEHVGVHHSNEVAQGYGAFGKRTVNYWLHNEWLLFENEKMSKSLGNNILASDLVEKGIDPLALRYLILTSHYRSGLNFTFMALEGAQTALGRLKKKVNSLQKFNVKVTNLNVEWEEKFKEKLEDDLDMPGALALVWDMLKNEKLADGEKLGLVKKWDEVLGLRLIESEVQPQMGKEIEKLVEERKKLRQEKKWQEADKIRGKIEKLGYVVEDNGKETVVVSK
jgi:cysteinyl-tRNA synthetase